MIQSITLACSKFLNAVRWEISHFYLSGNFKALAIVLGVSVPQLFLWVQFVVSL